MRIVLKQFWRKGLQNVPFIAWGYIKPQKRKDAEIFSHFSYVCVCVCGVHVHICGVIWACTCAHSCGGLRLMLLMFFDCSFSLYYVARPLSRTQSMYYIQIIMLASLLRDPDSTFRGWNYSRPPTPSGMYIDSDRLNCSHHFFILQSP